MPERPTYSVRALSKFQHYRNRNPLWIKLYQTYLSDPDLGSVSDGGKFFFAASILLASRYQNMIPLDPYWLWKQSGAQSPGAVISYLRELKTAEKLDFQDDAASLLASCYQAASTERETETEREKQIAGAGAPAARPRRSMSGEDGELLRAFDAHHRRVLGAPYVAAVSRDRRIAQNLIGLLGLARVTEMLAAFWEELARGESNGFNPVAKAKPDVPGFLGQLPNLNRMHLWKSPIGGKEAQDAQGQSGQ